MGFIGGGGDKVHHHHHHSHQNHLSFHFLKKEAMDIPKGCMAVIVGQGEEQQRFVIPVVHINHPLFIQLLEEAEKEYGFDHDGPITIPCHVEEFLAVEGLIDKEKSAVNDEQHHHHHHHHVWCFRA
ncbi:putative small auxin-up RNA [Rosa chinensis]|uniref:Putative small auxin-up RNA n=1 Tax=Rosa chinensis TaxID=74649 RepID=A0A2P6SPE8_ROSCH|nr:auxin-responsive protein SAUR32 [Rosa chinensis]PRQ60546.1 putative small auxin-up RNA [Rosa chinensis]